MEILAGLYGVGIWIVAESPTKLGDGGVERGQIERVEDEALARRAFAQILRFEGHEVMEAADGVEALILLEKYPFDLVITDLVMPNINGLSLIARIQVKWPKTAILLTSAYLTPQAAQIVLEGKPEFIHKPIDPPLLIATVQRLLPSLAS